ILNEDKNSSILVAKERYTSVCFIYSIPIIIHKFVDKLLLLLFLSVLVIRQENVCLNKKNSYFFEAITSDLEKFMVSFSLRRNSCFVSLAEEGIVPVLVQLLTSVSAGEDFRVSILQEGELQGLLNLIDESPNPDTLEHIF
ncbi:hypothetical protein C5167_025337, partial [Papaver somniferum]